MGHLGSFILERTKSLVSKRVAAGAAGVALIAANDPVAGGWAAIAAMGIQAVSDTAKYYIDAKAG